jgi:hypothetical protein
MAEKQTLYLPRIQTKLGVAGYKGNNVRYIDQEPKDRAAEISGPVAKKPAKPRATPPAVKRVKAARASSR